jgi:hypothetical protein
MGRMKELKAYFMMLGTLVMLITVPGAMTTFLHYITILEFYAHHYMLETYVLGGIVWTVLLTLILNDYIRIFRPKKTKLWIIDEKYLNKYDGYYEGALADRKPKIVKEVKND